MSAEHIIASINWQNFLANADSEGLQKLYPLVETMRLALLDQNITLYNEAKTAWLAQIAALSQADKNTFNTWAEANNYGTRF